MIIYREWKNIIFFVEKIFFLHSTLILYSLFVTNYQNTTDYDSVKNNNVLIFQPLVAVTISTVVFDNESRPCQMPREIPFVP